jgi:hypothetical protein
MALQRDFPKAGPMTFSAASIGRDQQLFGLREWALSHLEPPAADAVRGELGSVLVDAYADPALVVPHVVDSIGDGIA